MPLYMDVHEHIEGLTADAVAQAHRADLKTQDKHDVEYQRYWFDEGTGKVFCLIKAPNKEAAIAVHREAHGLVADSLTEVREGA
jgi:peptidyl-tRNA hydrolase